MEYFWWLYLATRLDAIVGMFSIISFVGAFLFFLTFLIGMVIYEGDFKQTRLYRIIAIIMIVIGTLGSALVPTKKDAMFIAGGVGVIEASKAIAGSEIAKKSVAVVEAWLESQAQELRDRNKNNQKK